MKPSTPPRSSRRPPQRPWAAAASSALAVGAVCLAALVAGFAGCRGQPDAEAGEGEVASYTVEGEIRRLPTPGGGSDEVWIRHEAIPSFVDMEGETVGMEAMTMPFPAADPALLEGLEVGDRVVFDFEVRWQGSRPLLLTRIEKLEPATPGEG